MDATGLRVRWTAGDPDAGAELTADVSYSSDDGRTWRPFRMGPNTGEATIAKARLAGSRRARVRVTVSDGFAEGTVTSAPFAVRGTAPRVTIVAPERRAVVRAGERITLAGNALDDRGSALTGRSLTWFAGTRRLGRGSRLRVRLPRGTRSLRLVARDRNGLASAARVAVRVTLPALRIVSLRVPERVGRTASTMRVRIRTSAPATLAAGGRRYRLGRSARTVVVRLPRRPAVGVLNVPFRITPRGGTASGRVTGKFSVARA
jgi:hypothetical protein